MSLDPRRAWPCGAPPLASHRPPLVDASPPVGFPVTGRDPWYTSSRNPDDELLLLWLWRQLPKSASFHELCDEVRIANDSPKFSSRTTLCGFSSAFKTCRMLGRFEGFEWRHARAMIAIAHTSSSKSSSTMSDGSTSFGSDSLSWTLINGSAHSSHVSVRGSATPLMPSLPDTSSRRTFPKLYTSELVDTAAPDIQFTVDNHQIPRSSQIRKKRKEGKTTPMLPPAWIMV